MRFLTTRFEILKIIFCLFREDKPNMEIHQAQLNNANL